MNIITLSQEKSDYETQALPIALYPEHMLKNDDLTTPYFARVINRGKFSMETIADDLIVNGSTHTKQEILTMWHEINAAIIDRLINGGSVDTEITTLSLSVKGLFHGTQSTYNRTDHSIELNARPTPYLREILDALDCKIALGTSSKPYIKSVYDHTSQTEDAVLTRGGFLTVKGDNIRLYGDDESVGIYFVSESETETELKLDAKYIISSTPGSLQCRIPDDLEEGSQYRIKIQTQYMRTTKARKTPLACVSDAVLSVE